MPIEPVMVIGSAKIRSQPAARKLPPEAATSPIEHTCATTRINHTVRPMSEVMTLAISLRGPDHLAIFRALYESGAFGSGKPDTLWVGSRKLGRIPEDWVDKHATDDCGADWGPGRERSISNSLGEIIKVRSRVFTRDMAAVLDLLASVPFTVAALHTIHPEWSSETTGFGDLHFPHGLGCAFRGAGHDQLVSRRWLDFGPWRLLRGPSDTSLVQFHDLDADSDEALVQARPGHERMGLSPEGGYIEPEATYEYSTGLGGRYYPDQRRQKIMAGLREVTQVEMRDACAARLYQRWGEDRPSEHVGFNFMEEMLARRHLHELWLRELECWAVVEGRERRLDGDYTATPEPPEWVERLRLQRGRGIEPISR